MGRKDTKRPVRVDRAPDGKPKDSALVTSDLATGSIVLGGGRKAFTLAWSADCKGGARAIPPGDYRIRSARRLARKGAATWVLSSCSPRSKPMKFAAGATTRLTIGETVHLGTRVVIRKGRLNIGFALTTDRKWGASVFQDGKRIPVRYELLDKSGKKLSSGPLKYG